MPGFLLPGKEGEVKVDITMISIQAPRRLESFVLEKTGQSFPQWRDQHAAPMQQVIDLLWRASSRLEQFLSSGRKAGKEVAMLQLADAQASVDMAMKKLSEMGNIPIDGSEEEEERVCRECGGRNGSVARDLIDDVISEIDWNHGKVGSCLVANVFAAWYRITRELKKL